MLGFVTIGTNNIKVASRFYDAILVPLGIERVISNDRYVGYAESNNLKKIELYLMKPFNQQLATNGNGTMIALFFKSRDNVDRFHDLALQEGAISEGLPGIRPPGGTEYYAYIRDGDNNKICAYTNSGI